MRGELVVFLACKGKSPRRVLQNPDENGGIAPARPIASALKHLFGGTRRSIPTCHHQVHTARPMNANAFVFTPGAATFVPGAAFGAPAAAPAPAAAEEVEESWDDGEEVGSSSPPHPLPVPAKHTSPRALFAPRLHHTYSCHCPLRKPAPDIERSTVIAAGARCGAGAPRGGQGSSHA